MDSFMKTPNCDEVMEIHYKMFQLWCKVLVDDLGGIYAMEVYLVLLDMQGNCWIFRISLCVSLFLLAPHFGWVSYACIHWVFSPWPHAPTILVGEGNAIWDRSHWFLCVLPCSNFIRLLGVSAYDLTLQTLLLEEEMAF